MTKKKINRVDNDKPYIAIAKISTFEILYLGDSVANAVLHLNPGTCYAFGQTELDALISVKNECSRFLERRVWSGSGTRH